MCTAAEVVDPSRHGGCVPGALASDVGKALNPQQVEAQDEGAAVMGLGHSLMEHRSWTSTAASEFGARLPDPTVQTPATLHSS